MKRNEPLSLTHCLNVFIEDCRTRDFSAGTLQGYRKDIGVFIDWAWRQGCVTAQAIDGALLDAYEAYLSQYQTRFGTVLKPLTRQTYLLRLYALLRWLTRQGVITVNPAENRPLPRGNAGVPNILSVDEMARLMAAVDVHAPYGVRDRAILETLYSTGMRGQELARLIIDDLNQETGWVMIREGKGKKDRRIPIGESAVEWIQAYLTEERPKAKWARQYAEIFLSNQSRPFRSKGISALVARYIQHAGLREKGGSHLVRHSMAAHMLENGADIRYIQQMLGHADLKSTQIYTQVSHPALKAVHSQTHPAKMQRKATDVEKNEDE